LRLGIDIPPHIIYDLGVAIKRGDYVSPQMGRPKAENPKDIKYSIRMDAETEAKLKAYCEENGITKGEAIRQGIYLLLKRKKKK
jgi:hypothetical protein